MKEKSVKVKKINADTFFDYCNFILWIIILTLVLYPLWLIIIASVSDPDAVMMGEAMFLPVRFSLMGYEAVFQHRELLRSYINSVLYTVTGSAFSVLVTMMAAYALTRKFAGKKGVTLYIIITMFFSGGLIPQFLMNRTLGLYNTVLIMIILNGVSVWNLMVARTYISSTVPNELYEAASIDGANHFIYFFQVVLPLSGTIIAVLAVYYGVARWNDYFTALVYIRDRVKLPLQTILREVIATLTTSLSDANFFAALDSDQQAISAAIRKAQVAKYCCIVVSTAPTVALYMLMQKYFVKGVLIGSLKG